MAAGTPPNPWGEASAAHPSSRLFCSEAAARSRLAGGEKSKRARVSDGGTAAIGRTAMSRESSLYEDEAQTLQQERLFLEIGGMRQFKTKEL
ncbi:hypothetical protein H8A99_24950 [Bradyrhizobium sp. Arg68]|uniref:hypothetical protein n=1 Tax=Bradyrhizobium ivorense TaxID=2511166 RepID=UPI001E5380CF|nr:hypothetical protein [Bradyrhizobium ivorense]MCC8939632.1 hypothetical protein [Bradyrhizobium ivorense]